MVKISWCQLQLQSVYRRWDGYHCKTLKTILPKLVVSDVLPAAQRVEEILQHKVVLVALHERQQVKTRRLFPLYSRSIKRFIGNHYKCNVLMNTIVSLLVGWSVASVGLL